MLFIIAILVLIIDQASKAIIRHTLYVTESVQLIPGVLHVTHVKNPGAAFGILPNQQIAFFLVSMVVILFTIFYYMLVGRKDRLTAISLGLVLGGAVGNLIDRVVSGSVTDFIDFRVWPVFNVADSSVVVGVIILSLLLVRSAHQERTETN
ncbi:MAG TPA: signal peptidase II [Anaerolineae bacterium]|nr:signal peptidase II [Anaerolineae bacterium]